MSFPDVKAIIFDYGNVLCEPQPHDDLDAMAYELGLTVDEFMPIYWRDRGPYDRDEMDAETYWNRVAQRQLPAGRIAKLTDLDSRSWMHPRAATVPWVEATSRLGLRTALLSNLPAALRDALESEAHWLPRFDVRTYSCTIRKTKPSREIYEHCIGGLGVMPSEIVFLDDRQENIEGAAELGIHGILFDDPARVAKELSERYGLTVSAGAEGDQNGICEGAG